MSSIIELLMGQLGGENLGKISRQVGAREEDTADNRKNITVNVKSSVKGKKEK